MPELPETATIKLVPDLSGFTQLLSQELDLDDPLAKAIINYPDWMGDVPDITATVGGQTFTLHHWTVTATPAGSRCLRTAWQPAAEPRGKADHS